MPEKFRTDKCENLGEDLPDNVCLSDLCDCGHHKSHSKPITQQHRGPFPMSDYMSTYKAIQHPKPRSSKRPPMAVRELYPLPMNFSTSQREDFKGYGHVTRVKPITNADRYEPLKQPMEGVTFYSQEFTPKLIQAEPPKPQANRRDLIHQDLAKFDDITINKEHFKRWVSQPRLTFGELPSFTGSLLFPDKENIPLSITRQSYTGVYTPSAALAQAAPDSIRLEGDHIFDTTHNATYRKIDGDHRVRSYMHRDNITLRDRGKFTGLTQTKQDFPGFQGKQPCPPKPIDPPQPTIDLTFDTNRSFTTENRSIFQGHDVIQHPVTHPYKREEDKYKLPSVKFETETSQKRDYQPIDLTAIQNQNKKIPHTNKLSPAEAEFDGKTMNNEFFKKWRVLPRIRYGDFHENRFYIPPMEPFVAQSVTKSSFIPQPVDPVHIFRPVQKAVAKDGQMDFKTEYQEEFQKKQARLCRAQVYLMQQELKRKKEQQRMIAQPDQNCSTTPQATHITASKAGTAA